MSSTEFNIGLSGTKNSSRVLKPPGGGHSDIFGAPSTQAPGPRPKYDQQNSSNLNFCMNTTDPNVLVEQSNKSQQSAAAVAAAAAQPAAAGVASTPQQNGVGAGHGHATNGGGGEPAGSGVRSSSADSIGSGSQQRVEPAKPNRVPPGGFSSGLW